VQKAFTVCMVKDSPFARLNMLLAIKSFLLNVLIELVITGCPLALLLYVTALRGERSIIVIESNLVTTQAVIASEAKQSPSRKEEIASSQKTLLAMTWAEQLPNL
jgi:hypothetical protein